MNIHEYQAKELLAKHGVPVPAGHAAMSVDEAVAAAGKLPGPLYVVKAQIHAGGRGKGKFKELGPDAKGGVRLARSMDEVRAAAQDMLGNRSLSIDTFRKYVKIYKCVTDEQKARSWNGGPSAKIPGTKMYAATNGYWTKVKAALSTA